MTATEPTDSTARSIFVTGIGRGLGRELASQLIERGDRVWGSTRSGDTDLAVDGCVSLELGDPDSIAAGMAELSAAVDHLDLLINNAGTNAKAFGADTSSGGPLAIDADAFNAVMEVNATAPLLVTAGCVDRLRAASGHAQVVNVSSQLGSMEAAASLGGDVAYCASKAALNMVTVKLAVELRADGIGVVCLHPGWVQTDMGGPNADLTIAESARSILATIDALTLDDTGRFLRWDGTEHPW